MHLWSTIAAAATMAVIASAQTPSRAGAALVFPIPGVPLSVETIEERVIKNPDGTSTTEVEKTKEYRDVAGRMRVEMELPDPDGSLPMIQLADPVEGFIAILETQEKIAHRVKFKNSGPGAGLAMSMGGGRGLSDVPGKKTRKEEALGKRMIDTIEYEGSRTTTTSDEQPSLVAVSESWGSQELGLIGLVKYSGPDGESTSRIEKVDRTVPDPALFVIPADYRVRDLGLGGPVP